MTSNSRRLLIACAVAPLALAAGLPGADTRVNLVTKMDQIETSIAANPLDPLNLVAVWIDFGPVGKGSPVYGFTKDGGRTWQNGRLDYGSVTSSSDPSVAADRHGNFYILVLSFSGSVYKTTLRVFKSTDGGATFSAPVVAVNERYLDKPYIGVDPLSDAVYVAYTGNKIEFARSTDGGRTFTAPVNASGTGLYGDGAIPLAGPGGETYVVTSNTNTTILINRSVDGGSTWLPENIAVARFPGNPAFSYRDSAFKGMVFEASAVDWSTGPHRGRIYIAWPDSGTGDADIKLAYSDDRGDTWSAPVRVNDDPSGNGADQYGEWLAVDGAGRVQVTFLDHRDDPAHQLYAMYLATSTDGGATFGPNIRVSDGLYGSGKKGGFGGDYTGSTVAGDRLFPLWPDARLGDFDVYTRGVNLEDYDEDGIPNDGDLDGQYADHRCSGGQTRRCDDNCPGVPNADQRDADADGIGDACDVS